MWRDVLDRLPRGYTLDEKEWQRRHRLLLWTLGLHVPGLFLAGLLLDHPVQTIVLALIPPALCLEGGRRLRHHRRTAAVLVTFGLAWCSAVLVAFSRGTIEAHFHFFIIIGFIALYQDWAPFLLNIVFTVASHGIGSAWQQGLIFNGAAAQANPWLWSLIHGIAVLFACLGMMLFWRVTEESQEEKDRLGAELAEARIGRFTSDLLTNLARRNQSLLHRQLEIINQLEESEHDPDALAELFTLDHLATRARRNAENLLVLSGEQPPRVWSGPVPLRDVVRAAIAETEDLTRVTVAVDEGVSVVGHAVSDLTHLLAELTENAVRFSPPDTVVTVRSRLDPHRPGTWLLTVEDFGIGMPADVLAATNDLLATPPEIDLSVSQRLGFHVVARLAARHHVGVSLSATPGSGITALVVLPAALTSAPTGTAPAGGAPLPRAALAGSLPARTPNGHHRSAPDALSSAALRDAAAAAGAGRVNGFAMSDRLHAPEGPLGSIAAEAHLTGAPAPADRPDGAMALPAPRTPSSPVIGQWPPFQDAPAAGDPMPLFEARTPASERPDWSGWWEPVDATPAGGSPFGNGTGRPDTASATSGFGPLPDRPSAPRPPSALPAGPSPAGPTALPSPLSGRPAAHRSPSPRPRRPEPPPDRAAAAPVASADGGTVDGLRRRVPQAHLVEHLRQPQSGPEAGPGRGAEAAREAAAALSRYQAHRDAGRAAADGGRG